MPIKTKTRGSAQETSRSRAICTSILLGAAAVLPYCAGAPGALAQAAERSFSIPAQPLASALVQFSQVSGFQVIVGTNLVRELTSPAVSGTMSDRDALERLLSVSGLRYSITGGTVVISDQESTDLAPGATPDDGAVLLDTVIIAGGTVSMWDGSRAAVYETAGSVSHISGDTISAFRGTSPADILASDVTVLSGEARTSGSLNVNIRGLQGQGRTPVLVDGTLNQNTVYRGYQGASDRTFIDPDFIGGVSITRGASIGPGSAGAVGGKVEMNTISADDIVAPGRKVGARLKFGMSGNSSTPKPVGTIGRTIAWANAGYSYANDPEYRPGLLDMGGRSASIALAATSENFDIVLGYAWRDRGNYHVGTNGNGARTAVVCNGSSLDLYYFCQQSYPYMYGLGDASVAAGDEMFNTSEKTNSGLLKATWRFGDGHSLEFIASEYRSSFGENYPSDTTSYWTRYSSPAQRDLSFSELRRGALTWKWRPEGDLIDLRLSGWKTGLKDRASNADMKFTDTTGVDASNTSRLTLADRAVTLQYGLSWRKEETGPDAGFWTGMPGRHGSRRETSLFLRGEAELSDRLALNFGLAQQRVTLVDLWTMTAPATAEYRTSSHSLGVVYRTTPDLQLYANYTSAGRNPSLVEGTRGFGYSTNGVLRPERAKTFELGANLRREGLFRSDDLLNLKLTYFHNTVQDYISRQWINGSSMRMLNIDQAKFEGVELAGSYRTGSFTVDLSANYFVDMQFCRTAGSCVAQSLGADFATNHIPPKYSLGLTLTKTFLEERLALSTRITRFDERTIPAGPTSGGSQSFIEAVPWRAQTIVDVYGKYDLNHAVSFDFGIDNLTDRYYIAPLSLGPVPSPGRTLRLGVTAKF